MAFAFPIVLLVFNRPGHTRRVLERVRAVQPRRLLVVGDGPRVGRPEDDARCAEVRRLLSGAIDWDCTVEAQWSDQNLGCGRRVASGIDWVFSLVDEAVFLEDDCLPSPDFFPYCAELLGRYRDDARVGQICGCTFVANRLERPESYLFSRYGPVWGWASWRRAWRTYDFAMNAWPGVRVSHDWPRIIPSAGERAMRTRIYEAVRTGRIDTWDYQWGFAKMTHGLLSAIPCTNLVENIGFNAERTHAAARIGARTAGRLAFPLVHPPVKRDEAFDREYSATIAPGVFRRIRRKLTGLLRREDANS